MIDQKTKIVIGHPDGFRACPMLRGFAFARRWLARLRCTNNYGVVWKNALRAFFHTTKYNKRAPQARAAIVMAISQILMRGEAGVQAGKRRWRYICRARGTYPGCGRRVDPALGI